LHALIAAKGEDSATGSIASAKELEPDVAVLGPHGSGLIEGLLGSTGPRQVRRESCPVLVLLKG